MTQIDMLKCIFYYGWPYPITAGLLLSEMEKLETLYLLIITNGWWGRAALKSSTVFQKGTLLAYLLVDFCLLD